MTKWLDKIEARVSPRPDYMRGDDDADIARLLRIARAADDLMTGWREKGFVRGECWDELDASLADKEPET